MLADHSPQHFIYKQQIRKHNLTFKSREISRPQKHLCLTLSYNNQQPGAILAFSFNSPAMWTPPLGNQVRISKLLHLQVLSCYFLLSWVPLICNQTCKARVATTLIQGHLNAWAWMGTCLGATRA